jgi:hypothetical protein
VNEHAGTYIEEEREIKENEMRKNGGVQKKRTEGERWGSDRASELNTIKCHRLLRLAQY